MQADMSVPEMLNSFIFILKGSRVIDRTERDWGRTMWLYDERYIAKNMVFSLADMKRLFAHRVVKSKYGRNRDPFNDWLKDPKKFTAANLGEAMKFADEAARGLVEPRIDIDAIIRNGIARANAPVPPSWVRA